MNIQITLDTIYSIAGFFLPGYWMLALFSLISGKKVDKNAAIALPFAFGYILYLLIGWFLNTFCGKSINLLNYTPNVIIIASSVFLATILGAALAALYNSRGFSSFMVSVFNQSPSENIWRDVIDMKEGAHVIFKEKGCAEPIVGVIRHIEKEGNDTWVALTKYWRKDSPNNYHKDDPKSFYLQRVSNMEYIEVIQPSKKTPKRKLKVKSKMTSKIAEKYESEISRIKEDIAMLKGQSNITTIGVHLEEEIASLLYKIENNQPSNSEIIRDFRE